MSENFELRNTDSFIAAAVGPAGQRIFFLQGVDGDKVVTLKLEKMQVGALATALKQLLEKHGLVEPPISLMPLQEPVIAAWTVAELGAGVEPGSDNIVVVARELTDAAAAGEPDADEGGNSDDGASSGEDSADDISTDDNGADENDEGYDPRANGPAQALFHLRPELVGAFCEHALRLIDDGRDFAKRNGHRPLKN